ncbi:MAG TPA: response regulator [Fibrobacteria bacterium]|nr:response regulator [Fibrobacteria bacterium]
MTTILLVDDEEGVRNLVTATLKGKGYKVLLARDSDQAMQMSDAHEGPIELLIVDQVMPPFMGGPELAACIRMLRPEVKVLYISGYNASDAVLDELGDASADFLRKPFPPDVLLKKVRRLAGEAVAGGAA